MAVPHGTASQLGRLAPPDIAGRATLPAGPVLGVSRLSQSAFSVHLYAAGRFARVFVPWWAPPARLGCWLLSLLTALLMNPGAGLSDENGVVNEPRQMVSNGGEYTQIGDCNERPRSTRSWHRAQSNGRRRVHGLRN